MNRRFGFAWIWGLATVAIATIVGFVAYHAGQTAQIVTTTGGADGRVFYPGYYGFGFGFFPFFGLFFLFLIGFFLIRMLFWRPWGRGGYGGGYWHQHPHEHGTPTTPASPEGGRPDQTATV